MIVKKSSGVDRYLAVETELISFGGALRIYPRFLASGVVSIDPDLFPLPPRIVSFSDDTLTIQYQPLEGIQSDSLYWNPENGVICGEIKLTNLTDLQRILSLEMVFNLQKSSPGRGLSLLEHEGKNLLHAKGDGQHLICFLSGGALPLSRSHSGLGLELTLENKTSQSLRWITVLADSREFGVKRLNEVILLNWNGEISRRNITIQDRLKISTGEPDRDFVLAYSQHQAEVFLQRVNVSSAEIQEGIISPLDGLLLFDAIYPLGQKELHQLIKLVFPTLAPERPGFSPATNPNLDRRIYPLLAELAGRIQGHCELEGQLEVLIHGAASALACWFSDENDQDQDGVPEVNPYFFFDLLKAPQEGELGPVELWKINPYLESPGLSALLLNEIDRLRELQILFGGKSSLPGLAENQDCLEEHIHSSWDDEFNSYLNRDSVSHLVTETQLLLKDTPPGLSILRIEMTQPSRIGLAISTDELLQARTTIRIVVHGRDQDGAQRIENISGSEVLWGEKSGLAFSKLIYSEVDFLYFQGTKSMTIDIICPGTSRQDISSLFPLLVKTSTCSRHKTLLRETIIHPGEFRTDYGLRTSQEINRTDIQLPWNFLLIEAFLRNGWTELAAEIFSQLMNIMVKNICSSGLFRPGIDYISGNGLGPALSPGGLIPRRLLLEIAGLRFEKKGILAITGKYPFDFPLTIQFRGVKVKRSQNQTLVQIAGEKEIIHTGDQELRIQLA